MPLLAWFALLAGLIVASGEAVAEKRVALVIGNSAYRHVAKLPNTANDAAAISLLLRRAGFDVVETRNDLATSEMRRVVRDFSALTHGADLAVVYYAGHGIEIGGSNYLVPVDAALARDIDVEDETVSLDRLLTVLEPARRLRLVILDACRDNPFVGAMKRTMVSRSIGRGLARIEPVGSDTLVAFAAKAGSTAADGESVHSPFTAALLQHIATPGLDLRIAFGRVRDEVLKTTGNKQEPFVYGSLGGGNVALVPVPRAGEHTQALPSTTDAQAARDYELVARIGSKEALDLFLTKYPTGFYADLARVQRAKVTAALPAHVPNDERPSSPQGSDRKKGTSSQVPADRKQPDKKKLESR